MAAFVQRVRFSIGDLAKPASEPQGILEYWAYRFEDPNTWAQALHGGVWGPVDASGATAVPAGQGFAVVSTPNSFKAQILDLKVETKAARPHAGGLLPEPEDKVWAQLAPGCLAQMRPEFAAGRVLGNAATAPAPAPSIPSSSSTSSSSGLDEPTRK